MDPTTVFSFNVEYSDDGQIFKNVTGPVNLPAFSSVADNTDQLTPNIAVDPISGDVAVDWYDTRNNAADQAGDPVWVSVSSNGGLTFGAGCRC